MRPSAALHAVSSFSLLTFSLRLQVASFWVPHFHRLHYIFCQQSFARCTLMPHLNNTMSSSWCRIYLFGFYKTSWACLKVESMKLKSANIMVSSACAACTPNDWQVVHLGSLLQEDCLPMSCLRSATLWWWFLLGWCRPQHFCHPQSGAMCAQCTGWSFGPAPFCHSTPSKSLEIFSAASLMINERLLSSRI